MHVPESNHELVQIAGSSPEAERLSTKPRCCVFLELVVVFHTHCRQWVSLCGGNSEKDSCASKPVAFVLRKYLIRSILHSRKYVCVGFIRSLNEIIPEALS